MGDSGGDGARNAGLVARCLEGDARAWHELATRFARLVHSVPVRYGLPAAEVEHIGQAK